MTLPRLSESAVAGIIQRSAVRSGTPFGTGWPPPSRPISCRRARRMPISSSWRAPSSISASPAAALPPQRRNSRLPALWLADVCREASGGARARCRRQPARSQRADPARRPVAAGTRAEAPLRCSRGGRWSPRARRRRYSRRASLRAMIDDRHHRTRARDQRAAALARRIATGDACAA
jgi:hypothetical protein